MLLLIFFSLVDRLDLFPADASRILFYDLLSTGKVKIFCKLKPIENIDCV